MLYRSPGARFLGRSSAAVGLLLGLITLLGLAATPPTVAADTKAIRFTARSDTVDLAGLERQFREVARRVAPSVVAITASAEPASASVPARSAELTGALLERLLQGTSRIVGTGFCVDEDGFILTNEHVIRDARQLYVTTDDGRTYCALVIGSDPRSDLAILKIPAKLPAVTFADPAETVRGQWTIALGNPIGLAAGGSMSMSVGVVGALGRELPKLSEKEGRLYSNLIQTTAEVNPGNSGGPLFDIHGKVIGVVTAVVLPHKTTNGIGFAIPADAVLSQKIQQLKRGTPIVYGYLGVAVRDHAGGGVWVTTVGEQTPASGLIQQGDILVRVNGQAVSNEATFVRVVGAAPVDRSVEVVVNRNGREVRLAVRLGVHPDVRPGIDQSSQRYFWRGMELAPGTTADGGVLVCRITSDSPLMGMGVRANSLIQSVAGKPVRDLITLQKLLDETPAELCQVIVAPTEVQTTVASGAE